MSRLKSPTVVGWTSTSVTLLTLIFVAMPVRAQSGDRHATDAIGRVDFDFPDAPAATVEVDFKEGMLAWCVAVRLTTLCPLFWQWT